MNLTGTVAPALTTLSDGAASIGGGTRRTSPPCSWLASRTPARRRSGFVVRFSSNNGAAHQGGICFGDSGGPVFDGSTNLFVAVTSFVANDNCEGFNGAYRIDQADDLDFLAGFGVWPQ